MIYGMDYLGGAMFPNILLKAHPQGWAAGFFAETFGTCWGVVDKLSATGKCPLIRIHGPWTNHAYNPRLHDKAIFAALEKTKTLAMKYPKINFQFSPICESDAKGPQWRALIEECTRIRGKVEIVVSVSKGEIIPKYTTEIHGSTKVPYTPYQYSYDGTSTVDSNVEKDKDTHLHAGVFFMWHPSFNLKYKTKLGKKEDELPNVWKNDTAPPKERICKPTVELILSLAALANPKGKTKLKPRNLWKSHADRHNTPSEERAYKPVLISPEKVTEVILVDSAGKVIAKSTKRDPYNDGRWRYYFGKYGYQIAIGVLTALAGKIDLGTLNPAFREGDYRS